MALPDVGGSVSVPTLEEVIAEDDRLEAQATVGVRALMHHRWWWTNRKENPHAYSSRAYAERKGRSRYSIERDARAYELLRQAEAEGRDLTPDEAREQCTMSEERQAVTEAVASGLGVTAQTARQQHEAELRHVRGRAREIVEQEPDTTLKDAAQQAMHELVEDREERAEFRELGEVADRRREEARRRHLDLRLLEVENELTKAQGHVQKALKVSHDLPFTDEHRALLAHRIGKLRQLLDMLDSGVAGQFDADWDKKMRVIVGGV